MMSRLWHGWTTLANADACARSQHYEVRAEKKRVKKAGGGQKK